MTPAFLAPTPLPPPQTRSRSLCEPTRPPATIPHPTPPHACTPPPPPSEPTPVNPSPTDDDLHTHSNPPKPLIWSEIPFSSIEEELAAIDEYEREEAPPENDPWPKFLRGAAYEHWGQPKLALAQYAKTVHASGFKKVPELWERRAYNAFKVGNVHSAHVYYELGLSLMNESTGNELHFVYWFYDNFKDYLPKWNGPPAAVQRGITKYCMGHIDDARSSFVPQVLMCNVGMEHPLLWFMASCAKSSRHQYATSADLKVIDRAMVHQHTWHPRLQHIVRLYVAAVRGVMDEVAEAETALSEAIKADQEDDISTYVYLALYHDAFTGDADEKNRALDIVQAIGKPTKTHDTENFLFHVAKNRIGVPATHEDEFPQMTLQD